MTQERKAQDDKRNAGQDSGARPDMDGNQGEGNRGAAQAYNNDTADFAHSGKVREQAEKARRDLDGPGGDALRRAEEEAKSHARGEDPAVKRP